MALKEDLESKVADILSVTWDVREGQVVPKTDDVNLSNGAVKLEAAYLYADLADSTTLARDFNQKTAARAVRSYLSVMSHLVKHHGGEIRSFDGDRVMGIFIGSSKCSDAAICCVRMNWAFNQIIRAKFEAKYPSVGEQGYRLEHAAGVDLGTVHIVRAGVRGSNDLVSVGAAPNIAAKLSDIREPNYRSFITSSVYGRLNDSAKFSSNGTNMWEAKSMTIKGKTVSFYRSAWWRAAA